MVGLKEFHHPASAIDRRGNRATLLPTRPTCSARKEGGTPVPRCTTHLTIEDDGRSRHPVALTELHAAERCWPSPLYAAQTHATSSQRRRSPGSGLLPESRLSWPHRSPPAVKRDASVRISTVHDDTRVLLESVRSRTKAQPPTSISFEYIARAT